MSRRVFGEYEGPGAGETFNSRFFCRQIKGDSGVRPKALVGQASTDRGDDSGTKSGGIR